MFSKILIQETWNIPVNLNTDIPGYKPLIFKTRKTSDKCRNNIGGGIGWWIRDIYEYETPDKYHFLRKIFESLFLKIKLLGLSIDPQQQTLIFSFRNSRKF